MPPVATVMRRLLTGHALYYNRRHRRYGHLFQNRYKSILCQEDRYLLELVRYIHLNPIRANLVEDLKSLEHYAYCGHGTLMGKLKNNWKMILLSQMLFCVQRQLYHPFKKFICRQSREIVADELLAKQAADVTQFADLLFAGIYKVPMPVVNDNHVFLLIES